MLGCTHGGSEFGIVPIGDVIIRSIMNCRLEYGKEDGKILAKESCLIQRWRGKKRDLEAGYVALE